MFALWITTAPANGEDWTYLEPITENATMTVVINHTTNNILIRVASIGSDLKYATILGSNALMISKEDMLTHYDTVYLAMYHQRTFKFERDEANKTIKQWDIHRYRFMFLTSDGNINLITLDNYPRLDDTPTVDWWNYEKDESQDDQTTYTFHYP